MKCYHSRLLSCFEVMKINATFPYKTKYFANVCDYEFCICLNYMHGSNTSFV